jgi:hypothetical protein
MCLVFFVFGCANNTSWNFGPWDLDAECIPQPRADRCSFLLYTNHRPPVFLSPTARFTLGCAKDNLSLLLLVDCSALTLLLQHIYTHPTTPYLVPPRAHPATMHVLQSPLFVLLQTTALVLAASSESPSLLLRTSEHLARAHRVALQHSAGLARDLRIAFNGLSLVRRDQKVLEAGHKVYCTVPKSTSPASTGLTGNGTATATGTSTATPTRSASVTSGASTTKGAGSTTATSATASPTASQSSDWTVTHSYVRSTSHSTKR